MSPMSMNHLIMSSLTLQTTQLVELAMFIFMCSLSLLGSKLFIIINRYSLPKGSKTGESNLYQTKDQFTSYLNTPLSEENNSYIGILMMFGEGSTSQHFKSIHIRPSIMVPKILHFIKLQFSQLSSPKKPSHIRLKHF